MTDDSPASECPYPGIRPFHRRERQFFFGRRAQTDEVVARLAEHHFSAVIGGSGSGKSSLVRAGVIPELVGRAIPKRGDFWRVAEMTPGDAPLASLVEALDSVLEPIDDAERTVRRDEIEANLLESLSLTDFLDEFRDRLALDPSLPPELRNFANLLVLIDQFEEIFRDSNIGSVAAQHLVRIVVDAERRKTPGVYVIMTMRSEDLHRCASFLELPGVLNKAAYLTRRLDEEELAMAIIRPAQVACRRAGLLAATATTPDGDPRPFELPVLRRLLDSVTAISHDPDHLPLLQHTLLLLWRTAVERRSPLTPGGREFTIGLDDLAAALGFRTTNAFLADEKRQQAADRAWLLRTALDRVADRLFEADLSPNEQRLAEQMFRLLAHLDNEGQYKREFTDKATVAAVAGGATEAEIARVVDTFSQPYPFVRASSSGSIDVAHEALIRNWSRLRSWLGDERRMVSGLGSVYRAYIDRVRALGAVSGRPHFWLRRWFSERMGRDRLRASERWAEARARNDAWLQRYLPDLEYKFGALPSDLAPAAINDRLRRFRFWSWLGIRAPVALVLAMLVIFSGLFGTLWREQQLRQMIELHNDVLQAYIEIAEQQPGYVAPTVRHTALLDAARNISRFFDFQEKLWSRSPRSHEADYRLKVEQWLRFFERKLNSNTKSLLDQNAWPIDSVLATTGLDRHPRSRGDSPACLREDEQKLGRIWRTWSLGEEAEAVIAYGPERQLLFWVIDDEECPDAPVYAMQLSETESPALAERSSLRIQGQAPQRRGHDVRPSRYERLHRLTWYRGCEGSDCTTFAWRLLVDDKPPVQLSEAAGEELNGTYTYGLIRDHAVLPADENDGDSADRAFLDRPPLSNEAADLVGAIKDHDDRSDQARLSGEQPPPIVATALTPRGRYVATLRGRQQDTIDSSIVEVYRLVEPDLLSADPLPTAIFSQEILGHRIDDLAFDADPDGQWLFLRLAGGHGYLKTRWRIHDLRDLICDLAQQLVAANVESATGRDEPPCPRAPP